MSRKVSTPILWETIMEEFIPKLMELWEQLKKLKKHYPSVWSAMENQFELETFPKVLSKELFLKKLEVLILQDEELRGKRSF